MTQAFFPSTEDPVTDGLLAQRSRLATELADAELKALKALAGYKFIMFGYHAAQWVLLNRVAGGRLRNPFRFIVQEARRALEARGQATLADLTNENGDAVALEEPRR